LADLNNPIKQYCLIGPAYKTLRETIEKLAVVDWNERKYSTS
jgi:hypothetical protein